MSTQATLAFLSAERKIFFSSSCVGTLSSLSEGVSWAPLILILPFRSLLLYANQDFTALIWKPRKPLSLDMETSDILYSSSRGNEIFFFPTGIWSTSIAQA